MFESVISAPVAAGFKVSSLTCKGGAFGMKYTGKGLVALGTWMQEAATTLEKVSAEHAKRSSEAWLILTGQASLSDNKEQKQEQEQQQEEVIVEEEDYAANCEVVSEDDYDKALAGEELACR